MSRDEDELIGSLPPADGEDPRFADRHYGLDLVDNGAGIQIENLVDDFENYVEVEESPFMPGVVDNDGRPGMRPYVESNNDFQVEEGIQQSVLESEDHLNTADRDQEDAKGEDDFDVKMRHRDEAAVGDDGRPVGDLLMLAGAQQAAHADQVKNADYIRINPSTAYRALLGGRSTARPKIDPVQVINWVGDDVEACPVTISLTPLFLPWVRGGLSRGFADITWGTRDAQHTVRVDIGTGVQLTVTASVVYVSVGLTPESNQNMDLYASLGFYTGAKQAPLTLTEYLFITNGSSATVQRPRFASHVYFDRAVDAIAVPPHVPTSFTLYFQDASASALYMRTIAAGAYLDEPIKLSNDVAMIVVQNNGAAASDDVSARLMWGLYV